MFFTPPPPSLLGAQKAQYRMDKSVRGLPLCLLHPPPATVPVFSRRSLTEQLANRGENDIWRAFGAAVESSTSRGSASAAAAAAAGVAAAAEGVARAGFPAAPPPGPDVGAVAQADVCGAGGAGAGVAASSGGGGERKVFTGGAPYSPRRATEALRLNPVLEILFKALPPGLAGLSAREWVTKAAAAGQVDFLEV